MDMTGATEDEANEHFQKKAEHTAYLASLAPVDPLANPLEPTPVAPENPDETANESGMEGE
jgi:hypothetical protein